MAEVRVIVRSLEGGDYAARIGERELPVSREPLVTAARILRKEGWPGNTLLVMQREGEPHWSLRGSISAFPDANNREKALPPGASKIT